MVWLNVQAQQGRLTQVSSKHTWIKDQNKWVAIVGVYEQNGNVLSSDSSIMFEDDIKRQFFDAFNNVVITQPSGTVIYADRLHYDALAQNAVLTGNVRLVNPNSILTTNHLTYNLGSKIGTYKNGGRIVSQADTITSQRGYYFENRGDAFFRGKVIVRTPAVKVFTDSMNYNQITKDTYFYGPTDIKGNNKENLYTEKGVYNTVTGVAKFSKNNLYNEGSKFLSGDSLFYDKAIGIGEAFKNVVFVDTIDKFYAYGDKGLYTQADESILMTEKPYIITLIKSDSSSSTASDSTKHDEKAERKTELIGNKKTAEKQDHKESLIREEKPIAAVNTQDSIPIIIPTPPKQKNNIDSVYMTADTLFSRMILVKDYKPLNLQLNRDGGEIITDEDVDYGDDDDLNITIIDSSVAVIDIDTLAEDPKKVDLKRKQQTPASVNKPVVKKNTTTVPKNDALSTQNVLKADSTLRKNAVMPLANQRENIINNAIKTAQEADTTTLLKDTTAAGLDTAKTRIVKAYYNVRLFKSDLQAVADSVYYGMQDSMFRFMGRPMLWAQGTQISADTIYMQILNQKMENALLKDNAFMVNVVLDSVKFNQMKGRKITAFFANNTIDRVYVDGNAESLIFFANEELKIITEMSHDRGGRIKVKMENNEVIDYTTIRKVDQKVFPFALVTPENEILPGFTWRPQDRPTSKEDLLNRKRELPKIIDPKEGSDKKVDDKKDDVIDDIIIEEKETSK